MAVDKVTGRGDKYELSSKVPTMDILDGILVLIVVVCTAGPLIYRWWTGRDL